MQTIDLAKVDLREVNSALHAQKEDTNQTIWEGRAEFTASPKSEFASPAQSAPVLAEALFSEYPGNNGETVKVKAPE